MKTLLRTTTALAALSSLAACGADNDDMAAQDEGDTVLETEDGTVEPIAEGEVDVNPAEGMTLENTDPEAEEELDLSDQARVTRDEAQLDAQIDTAAEDAADSVVNEADIGADVYYDEDVVGVVSRYNHDTRETTVRLTDGREVVVEDDALLISPEGWIVASGIGDQLTPSVGVDVDGPGAEAGDDGGETDNNP